MPDNFREKAMSMIIPAPLLFSFNRVGFFRTFKMLFGIGLSYMATTLYLLRKRGPRAAWIFVSVKLFTPVGPGGAGLFWFFGGWFIRRFPQLYRFPKQIELEITTTCSKKCIHCEHTYWSSESQAKKQMSYDEVMNVLDQFPGLRWASLVGEGSSFEHKHMVKFVKYLKDRHIMHYIPDHMADWDDDLIESVIDMDMDGVVVSFDAATKETYERIKAGCNYEKTLDNIRRLLEAKRRKKTPLPEIMFIYIAMKENVHEIPDFVDLVASLGTRKDFGAGSRIGVVRLLAFEQILHLQLDDIPDEIIEEAYRRARKHDLYINFTGTNVREELPAPTCCMAWMEPYIMMDGYISQCCAVFISNNRNFIRKYSHGNVFKKDFKTLWKEKTYRTLRYIINKPDKPIPIQCTGCRIFNTLPREQKYGVINTHTGDIISLKDFYDDYMGDNMKWRYKDVEM
ncbi:MAG: radical SAM protein [bacterium]